MAIVLLTVAYALTAALLLNLNIASRHSAWLKAGVIVLTSALYIGSWYGYRGLTGWATNQALPDTFRVLHITIDERRRDEDTPSYIYYWVRILDEAGLPQGAPRAHRVAWSEAEAENAEAAISALEEGAELNGSWSRNLMAPSEDGEELTGHAGELSVTGDSDGEVNIRFMRAPPRTLPPKPPPG